MKVDINRLVQRYGQLEKRVRQWTENVCRPYCSVCRHVCCRDHFCSEVRQSVFLSRVANQFSAQAVFDPAHGWLGQTGCTLVAGRPPVCYEFVCRAIVDGVAGDSLRHHALLVVSMVMTYVGKKAIGGRHVVEVTRSADLKRINVKRFLSRLDQAEAAFDLAADFLDGRQVSARSDLFSSIVSEPRTKKTFYGD
ncbi:uncharacterized protein Dvar_19170 [Desulfosarcina variabilis str. Montpellier]|uniref:hypothetical protein n=1 Tax=Desulfosarcina variabilis TaxID=2300 RepID=UPI003AFB61D4